MSGLSEFYVTFGSQYGTRERHPISQHIHADGYVVVEAVDEEQARQFAHKAFMLKWADMYSQDAWDDADKSTPNSYMFPLGEIGRIDSNGILTIYKERI